MVVSHWEEQICLCKIYIEGFHHEQDQLHKLHVPEAEAQIFRSEYSESEYLGFRFRDVQLVLYRG